MDEGDISTDHSKRGIVKKNERQFFFLKKRKTEIKVLAPKVGGNYGLAVPLAPSAFRKGTPVISPSAILQLRPCLVPKSKMFSVL